MQATAPGQLVLNGSGSPKAASSTFDLAGTLTVVDARGRSQSLVVASRAGDLREYNLPPSPPPGAFDVRYLSQRSLEVEGSAAKFPVEIAGAAYPVTVSWNSAGLAARVWLGNAAHTMGASGSLSIARPSGADGATELSIEPRSGGDRPASFALDQNYPNPFNPATRITYALPENAEVRLRVYSLLGEEVRTLAEGVTEAGVVTVTWDGTNASGAQVASGVYICRLEARPVAHPDAPFTAVRKMLLMR